MFDLLLISLFYSSVILLLQKPDANVHIYYVICVISRFFFVFFCNIGCKMLFFVNYCKQQVWF